MAEERPFVRPVLMSLASAPAVVPVPAVTPPIVAARRWPIVAAARRWPIVAARRWPIVAAAAVGVLVLLVVLALVVPHGSRAPAAPAGAGSTAGPSSTAVVPSVPGSEPPSAVHPSTSGQPSRTPATHGPSSAPPTAVTAAATTPGPAAAPTVNLALHEPTGESSHTQLYAGRNATDGDATTYWESDDNAFPQWLQVDLGTTVPLDHIVLRLPQLSSWPARTQTLSVQGSPDGATFSPLAGSATYPFDPAAGNQATIHLSGQARFVRLVFTDNSVQHGGQLAELQVY